VVSQPDDATMTDGLPLPSPHSHAQNFDLLFETAKGLMLNSHFLILVGLHHYCIDEASHVWENNSVGTPHR
jgi:hypothetical protein